MGCCGVSGKMTEIMYVALNVTIFDDYVSSFAAILDPAVKTAAAVTKSAFADWKQLVFSPRRRTL
jgi:hypothetical protein